MGKLRSNESFLRLFFGRLITNAGDSMYYIASMWLVHSLTGSPLYTGLAGFLIRVPQSLGFLVGPFVDRWSLRSLLVRTQLIQCVCVLAVPAAAALGHLSVWVVLGLMPVLTFLNQFVYPAQSAALPRIVTDEQLVRANSLFSFSFRGLDMVFNGLSGALVAAIGAMSIYLIDSATFAVAAIIFFGLAIPKPASESDEPADTDANKAITDGGSIENKVKEYLQQLTEGFRYIRGSAIPAMLLGGLVVNFVFGGLIAVLPAFADSISGVEAYGILVASASAGSLVGSLGTSVIDDVPFGWVTIVGYGSSAVCWLVALTLPGVLPTALFFLLAFIPIGVGNVVLPSIIQSVVDDEFLARVMSIVSSVSVLALPIGSLVGGTASAWIGVRTVMLGMAFGLAFLSLYFLARPRLRRLPPVSEADKSAIGL